MDNRARKSGASKRPGNLSDKMRLGITGNTGKTALWNSLVEVIEQFLVQGRDFSVDERLVDGLVERDLLKAENADKISCPDLAAVCDMILSFGGDGTILNTAHEIGHREIPILGINLGRLGFLAHVEFNDVSAAIDKLDAGEYFTEDRIALVSRLSSNIADADTDARARGHANVDSDTRGHADEDSDIRSHADEDSDIRSHADARGRADAWALNEFTLQRQGDTGLLSIEVHVDGIFLNRYWADGLIVATPTGSTAYSLALGGPIMSPGCGSVLITPMAPHSLTVRPIVIPDSSVVSLRLADTDNPYIFTADGVGIDVDARNHSIEIKRADFVVRLVQLNGQDSFASLRNKLMWGMSTTTG